MPFNWLDTSKVTTKGRKCGRKMVAAVVWLRDKIKLGMKEGLGTIRGGGISEKWLT